MWYRGNDRWNLQRVQSFICCVPMPTLDPVEPGSHSQYVGIIKPLKNIQWSLHSLKLKHQHDCRLTMTTSLSCWLRICLQGYVCKVKLTFEQPTYLPQLTYHRQHYNRSKHYNNAPCFSQLTDKQLITVYHKSHQKLGQFHTCKR